MLIKNYKKIYDNIHGYITISNMACKIIDSYEFQRLRYMRQLSTCYFVFPNASHCRFEHSIGTYYLADKMLNAIITNSDINIINNIILNIPELQYYVLTLTNQSKILLDDYICELVKIAALCHDVGHGPFSHTFDDIFIPNISKETNLGEYIHHENRSKLILEHIIKSNTELLQYIGNDGLNFIKSLIDPLDKTQFIYQIVSNNLNGIDVDKFDYLVRDTTNLGLKYGINCNKLIDDIKIIDNIICYSEQMYNEVISIFHTRYRLFKEVYKHKICIVTQIIIGEIMLLIDPIVNISKSVTDIKNFCEFTDDYIIFLVKHLYTNINQYDVQNQTLINKAYNLLNRIFTRNLYEHIDTIVSPINLHINTSYICGMDNSIGMDDIYIHSAKIGYVSGKKENPLDNLYFYNKHDQHMVANKILKHQKSLLLSDKYQEYIFIFYIKNKNNKDLVDKLKNIINNIRITSWAGKVEKLWRNNLGF